MHYFKETQLLNKIGLLIFDRLLCRNIVSKKVKKLVRISSAPELSERDVVGGGV
jgi:hypothetical protein